MANKLADYKPTAYSFPDQLNLFQGSQSLASTFGSDYGNHGNKGISRSHPVDCIQLSKDANERLGGEGTTIKDAYKPYATQNYIPTKAARVPVDGGKISLVKTTKAVHIPARPRTQQKMSADKVQAMTSYSYQFGGEGSERSEPYRPKSELEGPSGERSMVATNSDYGKHNYGRPHIAYIPDTGLFEKTSLGEGTTNAEHFAAPVATKRGNLRPKTGVILGKEAPDMDSSYKKQFDGVNAVYNIAC